MIRIATIIKAIKEINEMDRSYMDIESESEEKWGYVTQKAEKRADAIRAKSEKLTEKTIARMHESGICSEEGLTPKEADELTKKNPELKDLAGIWVVGDGSWC